MPTNRRFHHFLEVLRREERPDDELLQLARAALAALDKRKNEDVREWAERLANDVAGLDD